MLARYVSIGGWSTATCSLWQSPSIQNISTTPCDPQKNDSRNMRVMTYTGECCHTIIANGGLQKINARTTCHFCPLQARTGSPQGHRSPVKMKASHLGSRKSLKNEAGIFQESSNDSNKHFEQCAVQWIQSNEHVLSGARYLDVGMRN